MRNIAGNRVFNMILLFTIIGEFIVPWIHWNDFILNITAR